MALNYTRPPIFPAHIAEDNLVSPKRIVNGYVVDGNSDKNREGFARKWHESREIEDCIDYGRNRVEGCGSPDSISKEIVDLLPSDPFGMDISTTFTAITGWLEDLEMDFGACGANNNIRAGCENYGLFAGFNLFWNNAMRFQSFPSCVQADKKLTTAGQVNQHGLRSACAEGDLVSFNNGGTNGFVLGVDRQAEGAACCSYIDDGAPHEALFFALAYLGVKDLLSVERVCRSLCYAVRDDPLLWSRIHIEKPLNERINDDILLQLTNRAQGNLQCLSLLQCAKITDDCLRHVLASNPRMNKLCVPACTRLSIDGIVSILRAFNNGKGSQGIRYLRIGGLYGVKDKQFDELLHLLGVDELPAQKAYKPHFYVRGSIYILCDDDRAIDIEACPRCQKLRLVYDCPAEGCQMKDQTSELCRACALCIARCIQCGRCINDSEYEETFCLELLCSDCLNR